jgi:hypothetical protein
LRDPIFKKPDQNELKCGSSSKMPALQAQSPEFKPQSHQNKKYRENKEKKLNTNKNLIHFL